MTEQVSTKQYVHSVYFERNDHNYIVINEKDNSTGESTLIFQKDLKRPFYTTKDKFQNHTFKKEYEEINKVDTHYSLEHKKYEKAAEVLGLNVYKANKPTVSESYIYGIDIPIQISIKTPDKVDKANKFTVLKSPFIYGIDIPIQVLIKTHYQKQNPMLPQIKIGALDIETSMLGENEVIIFTYVHEDFKVYTSIYAPFLLKPGTVNEYYTEDEIKANSEVKLREYIGLYNQNRIGTMELSFEMMDIYYFITDSELELIKWVFSRIHECKPDMCTIWNLDFDIPKLMERIVENGGILEDILCHPSVPKEFRHVEYIKDTSNVDHITLFWHNILISGYTRFVDGMCLYSRIRTVQGRDVSYALQYIGEKELNIGKLELEGGGYHQYLQKFAFLNYIAYNQCDNLPLILMEHKNKDLMTIIGTLDNSLIEQYNRQSYRLTNSFYTYAMDNNHVICASGNMTTPYCHIIPSTGGLVLNPMLTRNTAVAILLDFSASYGFHKFVADFDVEAIYPTLVVILNICKETKLGTCIDITMCTYLQDVLQGIDTDINGLSKSDKDYNKKLKDLESKKLQVKGEIIENFFLNIASPRQNAVSLGIDYFNLLGYEDFLMEYQRYKKRDVLCC